ncbi:MAG: metallophosphoesterase [Pseudomonadota bacterium]
MKLQIFSDLHIEFEEFEAECDNADVVIFAGDINTGIKGIDWIKKQNIGCPIIYVLGNHEYYRHSYPRLISKVMDAAQNCDIHVLENRAVTINGLRFHGATLWTDYELFGDPKLAGFRCQEIMNDFKLIRRDPSYSRLRSIDAAMIHKNSVKWLAESLNASESGTNIVISHHAPSKKSIPQKHQDDIVSAAYASNLDEFIEIHKPNYWFHGHIHNSLDYKVANCRVICNPRGYSKGERNQNFDPSKLIEI